MKDLSIKFYDRGETSIVEYDTIMDFLDKMEKTADWKTLYNERRLEATFFENRRNRKSFMSVGELVDHCKEIVK